MVIHREVPETGKKSSFKLQSPLQIFPNHQTTRHRGFGLLELEVRKWHLWRAAHSCVLLIQVQSGLFYDFSLSSCTAFGTHALDATFEKGLKENLETKQVGFQFFFFP